MEKFFGLFVVFELSAIWFLIAKSEREIGGQEVWGDGEGKKKKKYRN